MGCTGNAPSYPGQPGRLTAPVTIVEKSDKTQCRMADICGPASHWLTGFPESATLLSMQRPIADRQVTAIGFGCMSLSYAYGTPPSTEDAARTLSLALDLGYNHLDTARIYGSGHNEELIGKTLKGRRQEFYLASKTGIVYEDGVRRVDCRPETIRHDLETSLRLLQTDHIDLYYLHRRDFSVPIEDSVGTLADLVKEGKIGGIGLSEMSADTLRRAHAVYPITAMQTEYSLWSRNVELGVLQATKELGVALVAFSPVGRGALANGVPNPDALPETDLRLIMPRFQEPNWSKNQSLIERFTALANEAGVTPAQLSLAWVLSRGDHIHVIPGTANDSHLAENIARRNWQPEAELLEKADALINRETVAGARYSPEMQQAIDTETYPEEM